MIDPNRYYIHFRYYLDFLLDIYYGGWFGGTRKTRFAHLGAHDTASSFYFVLSALFGKYPVRSSDVLVDVGCGRGRVINWWLRKGYRNRIIGVELDEGIAAETAEFFKDHDNVEIIGGNILECLPWDGTLFYLYNSFNGTVLEEFKDRLKEVRRRDEVRLFYVNCEYLAVFKGDPYWTVHTNFEPARSDPEWPVRDLDVGIEGVAIITHAGQAPLFRG